MAPPAGRLPENSVEAGLNGHGQKQPVSELLAVHGLPDKASSQGGGKPAGSTWKWLILSVLVLQNTSCILFMRLSRSEPGEGRWSSQTGVIAQELMKGAVSLVLLAKEGGVREAFENPYEVLKSGAPAFLYLVQNNMQYIAATHLNAPTCAVLAQLKLLTTALFSAAMLNRRPSRVQWLALFMLSSGVATVAVSQLDDGSSDADASGASDEGDLDATSVISGVLALVLSSVTSGLASVYFEKILKGSSISMWARNLQMSLFSVVIGAVGLVTGSHWEQVEERGFFYGYTASAWMTISNNVFGGLLVAMAIKHADSIVKNFSTSIAIVFTAVVSSVIWGTPISSLFGLGASLVIYAVLLYGGVLNLSILSGSGFQSTQNNQKILQVGPPRTA